MRPHCRQFLEAISKIYELQIVTFGSRQYAHKIAEFIDPEKKYFAHRILSRDECINPMRKSGNLRFVFIMPSFVWWLTAVNWHWMSIEFIKKITKIEEAIVKIVLIFM